MLKCTLAVFYNKTQTWPQVEHQIQSKLTPCILRPHCGTEPAEIILCMHSPILESTDWYLPSRTFVCGLFVENAISPLYVDPAILDHQSKLTLNRNCCWSLRIRVWTCVSHLTLNDMLTIGKSSLVVSRAASWISPGACTRMGVFATLFTLGFSGAFLIALLPCSDAFVADWGFADGFVAVCLVPFWFAVLELPFWVWDALAPLSVVLDAFAGVLPIDVFVNADLSTPVGWRQLLSVTISQGQLATDGLQATCFNMLMQSFTY